MTVPLKSRASNLATLAAVLMALLLPTLTLLPLGGLYLWEKGYLLSWAIGALITVAISGALARWMLRDASKAAALPEAAAGSPPDPIWSPAEEMAWRDVRAIALKTDPETITSLQVLLDLGHETVTAVARRLHPGKTDPVWNFTLPEALAINERVSRRLNRYVQANIPFSDRLTVAQVLAIYRWRSAVDVAERAYVVWRLIRLANPATAMTHEVRERLSRAVMQWGREHVSRHLTETFVEEVGRAAIDLYGGRLKIVSVQPSESADNPNAELSELMTAIEDLPLRISVVGVPGPARARVAAAVDDAGLPGVSLHDVLDLPPSGDGKRQRYLTDALNAADIILWLANANSDEEPRTEQAIKVISERLVALPFRRPPVMAGVAVKDGAGAFAAGGRLHDAAARGALSFSAPLELDGEGRDPARDRDTISAFIASNLDAARRVQTARLIEEAKGRATWARSGRQAVSAAGSLAKSLWKRRSRT